MKINGVDYHYYQNLSDIYSPQYDWENLILTAGATEEDLNFTLNISERNPDQIKAIQQFIHEYIHYLQNFYTAWGVGIFSDLFIAYSKISVSKLNGVEKFSPPLNNVTIGNKLFDEGVIQRTEILKRLTKSDFFKYELKYSLTKINFSYVDKKVILSNGICDYTVGIKAIREHMANLGSFFMLGYNDTEINLENISCSSFIDDDGRLYNFPEYWIVFEYYYERYPNLQNIGQGLFFLFNECLSRANPDNAFYRFFEYFEANPNRFLLGKYFIDFVNEWLSNLIEVTSHQASLKLTIDHLEHRLVYINNNLHHDLPIAAASIVTLLKSNIEKSNGGRNIFPNGFAFSNLGSWFNLINKYGSSIVSFNQDIKLLGNSAFTDSYLQAFKTFNSVTIAFKEVNSNNRNYTCPFYIDIPICKSEYKDEIICDGNPYEMLKTQNEKSCCNLMSGIFLLGLDKRID